MRLRRKRPGLTRRALNVYLNEAAPYSYVCFAFQFPGNGGRWTPCVSVIIAGEATAALDDLVTYPTRADALAWAYRAACVAAEMRSAGGRETFGEPELVLWSKN